MGYKENLKIIKGESNTGMATNDNSTSYANVLKGNNSQPKQEKYEKKK
jgi:hypothetical protein